MSASGTSSLFFSDLVRFGGSGGYFFGVPLSKACVISFWNKKKFYYDGEWDAQAQDPRKRFLNHYPLNKLELNKNNDDDTPCGAGICLKRSFGQDELGPFWANRGKKDPTYFQEPLYVEEPYWVLVRRDEQYQEEPLEPFFTSRGKKESSKGVKYFDNLKLSRREFIDDVESPFFAAREYPFINFISDLFITLCHFQESGSIMDVKFYKITSTWFALQPCWWYTCNKHETLLTIQKAPSRNH
ncbi:hypothetical protein NQ315_010388 [Exocentrus adspersus]|uniref:Uncharacterized protein n=1 Tax=Exocentrus adspersus TaxID=1586481 RepID=A0AAV8WB53_9CUCU|nr:hypothetical protein NQ315_010388 [Exocentrus adspersus]